MAVKKKGKKGKEKVSTCSQFCLYLGTFAVVSMMVGNVVDKLTPDANFIVNGTNGTNVNTDARDAYRVQIASSFAILTGIFQVCVLKTFTVCFELLSNPLKLQFTTLFFIVHSQVLLGVVRFGFVVTYLSAPLIRAYTTGSAFLVCVAQLKYIFGVTPSQFSGPLSSIYVSVRIRNYSI